jgi:hypothetical protein
MGATATVLGHRLDAAEALAPLAGSSLDRVDRLGVPVRLDRGRVLWREGDWWRQGLLVVDGLLLGTVDGAPVATFGPGSLVAVQEVGSARERHPRTVVALEPTVAVVYTRAEGEELLEILSSPQGERRWSFGARFGASRGGNTP